jgi:hypothetical protein
VHRHRSRQDRVLEAEQLGKTGSDHPTMLSRRAHCRHDPPCHPERQAPPASVKRRWPPPRVYGYFGQFHARVFGDVMSEPCGLRRSLSDLAVSDLHRVTQQSPPQRRRRSGDMRSPVPACPTSSSLLLSSQICGVAEADNVRVKRVFDKMAPEYDCSMLRCERFSLGHGRQWATSQATGHVLESRSESV